jgi:exodeoxyribonuclease V alpha subunit
MDTLTGSVERLTYYNPENGYTVLRLRPDKARGLPGLGRDGLVTVVGNLPELNPGEHLSLTGQWSQHAKHGTQFKSEHCEQTLPATVSGIRRYLGSGLIKGIGSRLAERIVDHFGARTLEIIEDQPQRLAEVPDIGPKRTHQIVQAWDAQRQVKEIMLFLHSHGVSTNLAVKIYKTYGDNALVTVQQDPYQLARDIHGVGFKTADKIAQELGLTLEHPSRIEAGLVYVLHAMNDEGHVYAPREELTRQAIELLQVDPNLVPPALERLDQQDLVRPEVLPERKYPRMQATSTPTPPSSSDRVAENSPPYGDPVIYLTPFYYAEKGVSERLGKLAYALPSNLSDLSPSFFKIDSQLSAEQSQAIRTALNHPVSVLTGGPGTGKTTCLKALIHILESASKRYALASPTGRAAKRLAEATGRPASTIHRLLGYSPREGFKHNAEDPLPVDFLVVDEASMLDILLANHLVKALRPGAHLLLVGDVDQLPSVGAGDVLRDVIASGVAPVTRLSTIFRQAADSDIITNAHRINRGEMPRFSSNAGQASGSSKKGGDFFLFPAQDDVAAAEWVLEVVTQRIPNTFGFDPQREIQVLAPMYRGACGVQALNLGLQKVLNPPDPRNPGFHYHGIHFRPGDKVMQIQNNYDKDTFNGDIGFVRQVDLVEQVMTIEIDGRPIAYDFNDADQLVLAYAATVHKAQGSEFPVVVMPLVNSHYLMLQRNLLYTAITRARQLCVLVGSRRAIGIAVRNNQVSQRYTALDWRLRQDSGL